MAATPSRADAGPIIVTDMFGDIDVRAEAAAFSLALQSALHGSSKSVISRAKLRDAIVGVTGKPPRYALLVEKAKLAPLAKQLRASYIVAGRVQRKGTQFSATVQVLKSDGTVVHRLQATAPHTDLAGLCSAIANQVSKALKLGKIASMDMVTLGQLLPYVEASHALLADNPRKAAKLLLSADSEVGREVRAAGQVAAMVASNSELPLRDRVLCALAAGQPSLARRLLNKSKGRPSQELRAVKALTYLALKQGKRAAKELRRLQGVGGAIVSFARAESFGARRNLARRDALLLGAVLKDRYLPALARVAKEPPSSLSAKLLLASYKTVIGLNERRYAGLRAAISLRAAARAAELGLPLDQPLNQIHVSMLTKADIERLRPVVEKAVAAGRAAGYRLRGELSLRAANPRAGEKDLRTALERDPNDLRSRLLLGRTLSEEGKHKEAAAQLAVAVVDGASSTKLEQARAL